MPHIKGLNLEKLLKQVIKHVNMMLECNLKASVECLCLQMPTKALVHTAQDSRLCRVAQGLHIAIVLGVCRLERIKHNFLSHGIQCVLY